MPAPTMKQRKAMPASQMGLPDQEKYPMDTKKRCVAAKAYAKQELDKGKLNWVQYNQIVRKANARLKELGADSDKASESAAEDKTDKKGEK